MFLNERVGQADRGLAVIGFSLGACYALDLAADPEHIRSVVIFYGTGGGDYSHSRAAYLGHSAEKDEFEPQSNIDNLEESLRRAGRPVTFHRYSGPGHWFFETRTLAGIQPGGSEPGVGSNPSLPEAFLPPCEPNALPCLKETSDETAPDNSA